MFVSLFVGDLSSKEEKSGNNNKREIKDETDEKCMENGEKVEQVFPGVTGRYF